jgi:metal-sulfur cluster biosynthetic enzyme
VEATSLKEEVGHALQQVIDPETSLSIMRMDLIHDLAVTPEGDVSLVFRPSSPICPMAYTLGNAIHKAIDGLDGVRSVTISVQNYNRAEHLEGLLKSLSQKRA